MNRAHWGTRLGFIFAVAGSAVGLANIWRFPYIVGNHGGAAFLFVYFFCLLVIGFPVFMAEILIGRTAQMDPSGSFRKLGRSRLWESAGKMTVFTGLLVSSFYSAVAGWVLGYVVEALRGSVTDFSSTAAASMYYESLVGNPVWCVGFHLVFQLICASVLYVGVRKGIERWNEILMPMLFIVLTLLVIKGLTMPGAGKGLRFLLTPDWSALTPAAILIAMGQAFFTLSLGQGTMVTYGSYLGTHENLVKSCVPVLIMDTVVSILAAVAVFTIVFSAGAEPNAGPGLIFQTLPWVFSQIPAGYIMALLFFVLVLLAAITSEISAMEPAIAYLIDEKGIPRHRAVILVATTIFLLGIPSALSYSLLKDMTIFGDNFLDSISFLCSSLLIPLGGFFAVVLVGWRWGTSNAISHLKHGACGLFEKYSWLETYFSFCFKYCAPALMFLVFLNALGVFG